MDLKLSLTKGQVRHDCGPACELHRWGEEAGAGGATGMPLPACLPLLDIKRAKAALCCAVQCL